MKRAKWYLGLLLVGILLFVGGCADKLGLQEQIDGLQEQIDALIEEISLLEIVPPVIPIEVYEYSNIRIPIEQFQTQPHIDVVMSTVLGGELTVNLGSNPTTGYRWSEEAEISDETIVQQIHHVFLSPGPDVAGASGEEVWVFKALKRGTTTILLEYSRSWTGAGIWAVTITATIE